MTRFPSLLIFACLAAPAMAEDSRQLDAHEHGVGQLDIAIEGSQIAMEFHAPGADIVGFEYEAKSDADHAAIDAAVGVLSSPLDLFVMTEAAQCSVVSASAELESEKAHDDHDHDEHAEEKHDDHDHEDHAEEKHDDHDHEEHADEKHDDHDHEEHAEEASHTEFHAEYLLNCADPASLKGITFAYFDAFPNALEVEVQVISDSGASGFEVERDAPMLDLSAMF